MSKCRFRAISHWCFGLATVLFATTLQAQNCAGEKCLTGEGYAIEIIGYTDDRPHSPADTLAARLSNDRADVSGEFLIRLPGGGKIWATEDPAIVDPRMAVHSNDTFAIENGRVVRPIEFFIYKNYDAFIDQATIQIFDDRDLDRIRPIAQLDVPDGDFVRVVWNGDGARHVRPGDHVRKGQPIVLLRNLDLKSDLATTMIELKEAELRSREYESSGEVSQWQKQNETLATLKTRLEELKQLDQSLTLVAPVDGVVLTRDLDSNLGTYVVPGTELIKIGPSNRFKLVGLVDQDDATWFHVSVDKQVEIKFTHRYPRNL